MKNWVHLLHRSSLNSYRWFALPCISVAVIKLALTGSWFSALALSSSLPLMFPIESAMAVFFLNRRTLRGLGFSPALTLGLLVGIFVSMGIFLGTVEPAQAQFFTETEDWMKTSIAGMPEDMVALVFNVLRGVFVLYIGVSIVQVIQKGSQGEDWQTLARTPLIVVVAATMGDALANMVVGTA